MASSENCCAATSALPVSTAGPQLLISWWMASWSSTRCRRASSSAMRSWSPMGGRVEDGSLGVEEVVVGLVHDVAGQAGDGEGVDAVLAPVVDHDPRPRFGGHPVDDLLHRPGLAFDIGGQVADVHPVVLLPHFLAGVVDGHGGGVLLHA